MNSMKKAAPVLVAAAAVLWGFLVVFVRKMNAAGLEAMDIVSIRVYGSAFFLCVGIGVGERMLISSKNEQIQRVPEKESLLRIRIRDCWCFVGTGVFSIVFFSYCYFRNVQVSSVALSSILMYTSPVWVTLLSVICFKEKLTGKKVVALVMALTGCVLVSGIVGGSMGIDGETDGNIGQAIESVGGFVVDGISGQVSMQGVLLGLGSGIGYGLYSIFGRFALNKGYHPMTVSAYTFLFACVGVLPFVNLGEVFGCLMEEPVLWIWAVCISLLTTCLSFSLYTLGLQYMEPGRAAVLATLEPIVSTLVGVFGYQEPLTPMMVVGIVVVLAASILISR